MVAFKPRPVSFIRITGTHNTANEVFHCVHFESPCDPQVLSRYFDLNVLNSNNYSVNSSENNKKVSLNMTSNTLSPPQNLNPNNIAGGYGSHSVSSSLASNNSNSISSSLNSTFSSNLIINMNNSHTSLNSNNIQHMLQPMISMNLLGSSENSAPIADDDDNQTASTYSEVNDT